MVRLALEEGARQAPDLPMLDETAVIRAITHLVRSQRVIREGADLHLARQGQTLSVRRTGRRTRRRRAHSGEHTGARGAARRRLAE